jgi:pimeloyl-ACP methyl ester carboxylesterase
VTAAPLAEDPLPGPHRLARRAVPPAWEQTAVWFDGSDRRGTRVEVFRVGRPDDPPLVFVHGWGLSPRGYAPAINALAHLGWHVVAPTLPGFGDSTPVRGGRGTLARTAERVGETLDALGLPEGIPVVAHSYGCGVTVTVGLARSYLFSDVLLVCPIGGAGSKVTSWAGLVAGIRHEVGRSNLTRVVDTLPNLVRHPRAVASAGVAAKHTDLVADIADLAARGLPVTMVLADQDGVVPPARLRQLHAHDGVRIEVVAGNHGWLLADPAAFAARCPRPTG